MNGLVAIMQIERLYISKFLCNCRKPGTGAIRFDLMVTIVKINDHIRDHCIFGRHGVENYVPQNSAKSKASVRMFAVMVNMETVKTGKNFSRPGSV